MLVILDVPDPGHSRLTVCRLDDDDDEDDDDDDDDDDEGSSRRISARCAWCPSWPRARARCAGNSRATCACRRATTRWFNDDDDDDDDDDEVVRKRRRTVLGKWT